MKNGNNGRLRLKNDTDGVLLLKIPIDQIRPFAGQPRTEFNKEELKRLRNSMEIVDQQNPVSVRTVRNGRYKYELIDGERRWRADKLRGRKTILAIVRKVRSKDDQFIQAVAANFGRSGHTTLETARAMERMVKCLAGRQNGDCSKRAATHKAIELAAQICTHSPTWVTQHLGLLRLCPTVRRYITHKSIPFQVGAALCHLKPEFQVKYARHIMKHDLSYKRALHYIRKKRNRSKLATEGRLRGPSDDYRRVKRFFEGLNDSLDMVLDMPERKFEAMFHNRPPEDLAEFIKIAGNTSLDLKGLEETLKKIRDRKRRETTTGAAA